MGSEYHEPRNLGNSQMITIDGLVDMISSIAGKRLIKRHDLTKPQGVRGRNSDNSRLFHVLGWEPVISLEAGLEGTYKWVENELRNQGAIAKTLSAYAAD